MYYVDNLLCICNMIFINCKTIDDANGYLLWPYVKSSKYPNANYSFCICIRIQTEMW
jgi:hypothetical protein